MYICRLFKYFSNVRTCVSTPHGQHCTPSHGCRTTTQNHDYAVKKMFSLTRKWSFFYLQKHVRDAKAHAVTAKGNPRKKKHGYLQKQ